MVHTGHTQFGFRQFANLTLAICCCLAMLAFTVNAADADHADVLATQVDQHLAAGEFGPALKLAKSAASADQRADLLKRVAVAQQAAGEQDAAMGTVRQIPRSRNQEISQIASTQTNAGGAQFGMLMSLILQNTGGPSGPWEAIEGTGGSMTPYITGVKVAPSGLLERLTTQETAGQLTALGIKARSADLNEEVARKSQLRMVSLTRLERQVARRIEEGLPVPETMMQLAGLSQVKYIFVYPVTNEIVLAGPANGWEFNKQGQAISLNEGRPTLQLDDLVTVLRTFATGATSFGCSINTRDDGVKAMMDYAMKSTPKGGLDQTAVRSWVTALQKKLGRQDVVVWGVPADSRVARVIVEADYRMKLIGIDRIKSVKEIPSYFDLLPASQQANAQAMEALRWWLTMQFDGVLHSADKQAFEIQGSSVLCQSENQFLTAEGKHLPTGQSEFTNMQFAQNFTSNYAKLAAKDTVFADTQNIFDLALCAALIKNENLAERTSWNPGVFAPGGAYAPASYSVPKEIDSVVNHRVYGGKNIVVQVAGGLNANLSALAKDPALNRSEPKLDKIGDSAKAPELPAGRWWWDAAADNNAANRVK